MKKFKLNYVVLVSLLAGLLGGIMFFPVNLNDQYTCLYHRLTDSEHAPAAMHTTEMHSHGGEDLLHAYLVPYAFYWWASLAVILLSILFYRKQKRKRIMTIESGGGNL